MAGGDAAAVEHEAGDVEAGEGHDGGGHVLVAAGDADEAVEGVAAGDEFDGVGDDFAGDERGLHALRAHGDAVVDGDGVELHGRAAGLADALL